MDDTLTGFCVVPSEPYPQYMRAMELWSQTRLSVPKIASETGCTTQRVWKLARHTGLLRPPPPQKPPKVPKARGPLPRHRFGSQEDANDASKDRRAALLRLQRETILKLWEDGVGIAAIAARTQISTESVRRKLKMWGCDLKAPRHEFQPSAPHLFVGKANKRGRAAYWWRRT